MARTTTCRATSSTARRSTSSSPTPMSSCTWPSSSSATHEETRSDQPRGVAQRVRGDGRRRMPSGSSTPRRSPPTAFTRTTRGRCTEDVPPRGRESFYYSAQKAELEAMPGQGAGGQRHRGLRLPAVDRRRTRLTELVTSMPYLQAAASAADSALGPVGTPPRRRCSPTSASPSSWSTPRTSRTALRAGVLDHGSTGHLQPRGARRGHDGRHRLGSGWSSVRPRRDRIDVTRQGASRVPLARRPATDSVQRFRIPVVMDTAGRGELRLETRSSTRSRRCATRIARRPESASERMAGVRVTPASARSEQAVGGQQPEGRGSWKFPGHQRRRRPTRAVPSDSSGFAGRLQGVQRLPVQRHSSGEDGRPVFRH